MEPVTSIKKMLSFKSSKYPGSIIHLKQPPRGDLMQPSGSLRAGLPQACVADGLKVYTKAIWYTIGGIWSFKYYIIPTTENMICMKWTPFSSDGYVQSGV